MCNRRCPSTSNFSFLLYISASYGTSRPTLNVFCCLPCYRLLVLSVPHTSRWKLENGPLPNHKALEASIECLSCPIYHLPQFWTHPRSVRGLIIVAKQMIMPRSCVAWFSHSSSEFSLSYNALFRRTGYKLMFLCYFVKMCSVLCPKRPLVQCPHVPSLFSRNKITLKLTLQQSLGFSTPVVAEFILCSDIAFRDDKWLLIGVILPKVTFLTTSNPVLLFCWLPGNHHSWHWFNN